jgi:ATP-dependent DNA ligase
MPQAKEAKKTCVRKKAPRYQGDKPERISTYRQAIRTSAEPEFIEPMQCKPITALPVGEKWTFEIKLDGYRCIAVKRAREVTLS